MLTGDEQQAIIKQVKKMLRMQPILKSRVKSGVITQKVATESMRKMWDDLIEYLKETG